MLPIFLLGFFLLFIRLVMLQVIEGPSLAKQAINHHYLAYPGEESPRGDILDHGGASLTGTVEEPAAFFFPSLAGSEQDLMVAVNILGVTKKKLPDSINKPILVKADLSPAEVMLLKQKAIPGIMVLPLTRRYHSESLATHLLGYLKKASAEQLRQLNEKGWEYSPQEIVGANGLEARYEEYLRASAPLYSFGLGVDATGRPVQGLGIRKLLLSPGSARNRLQLTVDGKIQRIVEDALDQEGVLRGAVVVIDVKTGDVLAMASRPNFKPGEVSQVVGRGSDEGTLVNRALAYYYPGSVFKAVVASAALSEGLADENEVFKCIPGDHWSCNENHGPLTLEKAMAVSCNGVFIELAQRLGKDSLNLWIENFGLKNQVLLGYELSPGSNINIRHIANAAIGQEGVKISPLMAASLMATLASGGIYHQPRVVEGVRGGDDSWLLQVQASQGRRVLNAEVNAKAISLLQAVTRPGGTGSSGWVEYGGSAGKTGSTQTGQYDSQGKEINNAWFAGYAPLNDPLYAVAVLVEGGGMGGKAAAPLFKSILEQILKQGNQ